jgi:hypothetical protein
MCRIASVIAVVAALVAPAFAQKAEIEPVNAKWIDFFNKGDFAGVANASAMTQVDQLCSSHRTS